MHCQWLQVNKLSSQQRRAAQRAAKTRTAVEDGTASATFAQDANTLKDVNTTNDAKTSRNIHRVGAQGNFSRGQKVLATFVLSMLLVRLTKV